MPLRVRSVLAGLLVVALASLAAWAAQPASGAPARAAATQIVPLGNLSQDSGLPAFTSGVYALFANGYNCTWDVDVDGSVITGTMICGPPGTREDGLSGTVVQGTSVTVTRDCSGAFAGCSQTYVATAFEDGMFKGTFNQMGGPFTYWFTLTPEADTPPAEGAPPPSGVSPVGLWRLGNRVYSWVPIRGGYEERMRESVRLGNGCLVGLNAAITRFWRVERDQYRISERHWKKKWNKKQKKWKCVSWWSGTGGTAGNPGDTVTIAVAADGSAMDVSCVNELARVCWAYKRAGPSPTTCPAGGTRVFYDNFDTYGAALSKTYLSGWWLTGGTNVDVIGPGLHDLLPGNGNYIDMEGSGGSPIGHLTSQWSSQSGRYCLRVWVAGNQRNDDPDTLEIQFGNDWRIVYRERNVPFTVEELLVTTTWPSPIELIAGGIGSNESGLLVGAVEMLAVPATRPASARSPR